jgi:hypothetical protein
LCGNCHSSRCLHPRRMCQLPQKLRLSKLISSRFRMSRSLTE